MQAFQAQKKKTSHRAESSLPILYHRITINAIIFMWLQHLQC